ncbi:MAG: 6-pyruvoyl-tetrahydropterin synthase-related protein, partial [Acidimicrobiales bacterium]
MTSQDPTDLDPHDPRDGDLLVDDAAPSSAPEDSDWDWTPLEDADDGWPRDPEWRAQRERFVELVVDWFVVAGCVLFAFLNLHPEEILDRAVASGGDMGAHVWGPAFLRDHLLPAGRLSGWTPDWYAGFPAYHFYMVVPSLLIVALDVGVFGGWLMIVPLAAGGGLVYASTRLAGWRRWVTVAAAVLIVVFGVELPYGTAFKLVTVLGVLTLPMCAYAFGRLADLPFPGPALLSVASVLFLFDRNFTIYGGNVASTLAGEFAFSISLSLALLYLGVVIRGLRTGQHRALAAVLLALTGLCHLIPAFFALAGTLVIAVMRRPRVRTAIWAACVLPVAGLISAFWVLPFWWQRDYVNDMGWEKLPYATEENGFRSLRGTLLTLDGDTYWKYLIPRSVGGMPNDMRWVVALACVGVVLSIAFRIRVGLYLAGCTLLMAVAFVVVGEGRLWNARLLPFYYLGLYLLAAIGVAEVIRTVAILAARDPDRPSVVGPAVAAGVVTVAALVFVALPLRSLPGGSLRADGSYSWLLLGNGVNQESFVRSWAKWNYTGYEGKAAYGEYRDLVNTMRDVGAEHGCGRSFWEYQKEINRYGTPMALMLLPHWTDGCIGSMEGLFFEASATTPFHFLTQVELSSSPSAAQRDLPYGEFNLDEGVRHLQLMGVRYYLATSAQATTAARAHPDLTELATSGPWVIFEVADSELVESLDNEPAVLDGQSHNQHEWICSERDANDKCAGPAVTWYLDPDTEGVFLAASGPEEWQRVDVDDPDPEVRPVPHAEVSDLEVDTDRISFEVDRVGTPVLVKASYFPNWQASGAEGPYRVAPNLMVVVPTEERVELSYGRQPVEWIGYALTMLGIGLAIFLATRPRSPGFEPGPT